MTFHSSRHRLVVPALLTLTFALMLTHPMSRAETAVERRVDTAPAPHLGLDASSKPVNVHYVHLKDDYRDSKVLDDLLKARKGISANCVAARQGAHLPVKPPTTFPDQVLRQTEFEYAAPNRSIRYTINYNFATAEDCGLIEIESAGAMLESTKGICKIDLVRKTAKGACDAGGPCRCSPPSAADAHATGASRCRAGSGPADGGTHGHDPTVERQGDDRAAHHRRLSRAR